MKKVYELRTLEVEVPYTWQCIGTKKNKTEKSPLTIQSTGTVPYIIMAS
jgi:hypothetical protein